MTTVPSDLAHELEESFAFLLAEASQLDEDERALVEAYLAEDSEAAAEAHGFGWLAWAWDDPASGADDSWFALSRDGAYDSSADLTQFGREVVEDPDHGLLALARPATGL